MPDPLPLPVPINPDTANQQQSPAQPAQAAPDASSLPSRDMQSPIPAVNPIQERHSAIGRGILHVAHALAGQQVNYVADENNPGQVREVVSPRKPGGFFRDLLLGSMAGAAAGAEAPRGVGAVGGAALGAQAGLGVQRQQQDRRKVAAQSDANQQQRDEQRTFQAAQVAAHTINGIQFHHFGNLHNDKQVQSFNTSNGLVMDHILDQGGSLAPIISNGQNIKGKTGNGKALAQMFNADPQKVMQAGDGLHRLVFSKIDTMGLHNVNGRWVDSNGKDVDLDDRTSYHLVDVPVSLWGKNLALTAGTINDVVGHSLIQSSNPNKTYTATLGNMFALGLKNIEDLNKSRQALYSAPKTDEDADRQASELQYFKDHPDEMTPEDQHRLAVQGPILDNYNKARQQRETAKTQQEVDKAVKIKQAEGDSSEEGKAFQEYSKSHPDVSRLVFHGQWENIKNRQAGGGLTNTADKFGIKPQDDGASVLAKIPVGYRKVVQGLTDYTVNPATFPTRTSAKSGQLDRETAINLAKMLDSSYDETQYSSRNKMRQDFTSGKTGQNIRAINTAVQHLDRLNTTSDELHNTRFPALNSAINFLSKQGGSSKVTNFMTDANAVVGELSGIFKATGATDTEIKSWSDKLDAGMSPAQFKGFIQEGMDLMAGRLQSIRGQWESGMSKPADFSLINPQARKILARLPGGQSVLDAMSLTAGGAGGASSSPNPQNPQNRQQPVQDAHPFFSKFNGKADTQSTEKADQ
jgi:hypothetical protein